MPFIYKSSHSLTAFSMENMQLKGQVRNLYDVPVKTNTRLLVTIPYSTCTIKGWVPVNEGVFDTILPLMVDKRNYFAKIEF
jgi:hypothetical protein